MPADLDDRLRRYAADLDAVTREDLTARGHTADPSVVAEPGRHSPRMLAAAGLLVAASIVAVVLVGRPDGPSTEPDSGTVPTSGGASTDGPVTTIADGAGFVQTQDFGTEVVSPRVPDGWQVLDFRDFRFAVPGDWTVPISASCAQPSPGVVLVDDGNGGECTPAAGTPTSAVTFTRRGQFVAIRPGNEVTVGTLKATLIAPECADCRPTYQFDNGWNLLVEGPDAEAILATFTDSGSRRALQAGPVADASGWKPVSAVGIELLVPPAWRALDLLSTVTQTTDAQGNVNGGGGVPDPGTCSSSFFGGSGDPTAYLGTSGIVPGCVPQLAVDLAPRDGLWLREDDGSRDNQRWVVIGALGDAQVELLEPPSVPDSYNAARPLELRIRPSNAPAMLLSLGVGTDASVGRAILRSMRQVDSGVIMEPGTDPTYVDTTAASPRDITIDSPSLFDGGIDMIVFVRHGASAEQVSLILDALQASGVADGGGIEYLDEDAMRAEVVRVVPSESDRARIEADLPTMFTIRTAPAVGRSDLERFGNDFLTLPNVIDVRLAGDA